METAPDEDPAAPSAETREQAEARGRDVAALLLVSGMMNTAWDFVTPFVPLFVLELERGDAQSAAAWSGIAVGVSPLMTALTGPFWGAIAERFGGRASMLRTILTSAVLVALIALAENVYQLIGLRILVGALSGFYVLIHVLAAQSGPRERAGQIVGALQAISMVCLAIVPPIAGLLTDVWGLRSNFLLAAGLMLVSFVVLWRGYRPAALTDRADPATARKGGSMWALLKDPSLALLVAVVFVGQYVERTFWPLAPLLVVEMVPDSEQLGTLTGALLGLGSGATALSAFGAGRLSRRVPAGRLLLWPLVAGVVTLPLLAWAATVWQFIGLRILMGLLTGGTVTLAYARASALLPSDRMSAGFSLLACVAMTASALGPISLGTVAQLGLRAPFFVGAAAFGACALLLVAYPRLAPAAPARADRPAGAGESGASTS